MRGPTAWAADSPAPGCERGGAWLRVRAPRPRRAGRGPRPGPRPLRGRAAPNARLAPRCPLAHLLRVRVRSQARLQLLHNLERRLRRHRCHWRGLLAGTGLASRPRAAAPPSVHPRRRRKRDWPLPGLGGVGGRGARGPGRLQAPPPGWGTRSPVPLGGRAHRERPVWSRRAGPALATQGPSGPWCAERSQSLEDLPGVYGSQDGIRPQRQNLAL